MYTQTQLIINHDHKTVNGAIFFGYDWIKRQKDFFSPEIYSIPSRVVLKVTMNIIIGAKDCKVCVFSSPEPSSQLVSIQKWLFFTISASDSNFNAPNTQCIPALKIFVFLDLAKNLSFLHGH
jgi:hypothetical protein